MRVEVLYSFFSLRHCQQPSRTSRGLKWILMGALTRLFSRIFEDAKHCNDAVSRYRNVKSNYGKYNLSIMIVLSICLFSKASGLSLARCLKRHHPKSNSARAGRGPPAELKRMAPTRLCFPFFA